MLRVLCAFRSVRSLRAAASHLGAFVAGAALATAAFAHAAGGGASDDRRARADAVHTFAEALERIERHYVEKVDREVLVHGAIGAMIDRLDADSAFLTPREYRRLKEDTGGRYSGVGVSLAAGAGDAPVVGRVVDPSPAARAGLAAGDRIRSVAGVGAAELGDGAPRRFEELLRGPPGSRVRLRVADGDQDRELALVREAIAPPSVEWTTAPTGDGAAVGIVAIERFHDGTAREVAEAVGGIARAEGYPLRGVVLDVRGNPGGVLDAAVDVADLFLDRGTIATVRGRRGAVISRWHARAPGTFAEAPLVVLIDRESASAAEILAGALQDHDRALVAGTESYGKGSVQTLFDLPGGGGLRLTTSHYYTPAERAIDAGGLAPDVDLTGAAGARAYPAGALAARWRGDDGLVWAVEILDRGEATATATAQRGRSAGR